MEEANKIRKPFIGISLMSEMDFIKAALPLFEDALVESIEWSFDTNISNDEPSWLANLLDTYGNSNKLLGHGVFYSLFDAQWTNRQELWLKKLKAETTKRKYHHISEHFGFMTHPDYHKGFPLPLPLNKTTLRIGIDRLMRLQDTVALPIGIENLAFSFCKKDVCEQGGFIEALLAPINGFVILDLHNIYCQSQNFEIDMMELINYYPLHEVKEIHISGGSWQKSIYAKHKIRRDTHDRQVPKEIFDILPWVLSKCIHTEFVIIERLGNTFNRSKDFIDYKNDFNTLKKILDQTFYQPTTKTWGKSITIDNNPINDISLYEEQQQLAALLRETEDLQTIRSTNFKHWDVETWDMAMIDTARQISIKWNAG